MASRSVREELWKKRHLVLVDLYGALARGPLTTQARKVVAGASLELTGYESVNAYWLPQVMSEAIEAAEALRL